MSQNSAEEVITDNENADFRTDSQLPHKKADLNLLPQDSVNKPCGCTGKGECSSEMHGERSFVYAIGQIRVRFPSIGLEKEYHQAIGRADTSGQTESEVMRTALSQKQNKYLVRQLCWVLMIEGIETYILKPREPADYDLLVESLRAPPRGTDVDVVIGTRGSLASQEICNGLILPVVTFEQIYSFEVDTLMKALPKPEKTKTGEYATKSEELFYRIMQMADNVGAIDEHRCLNYLAVRYPVYYEKTADMYHNDFSLSGIEVRPSRLNVSRKIVDCIFVYTNRKTDFNEKWFCRVDVSEMFPFLVTKMSPYYDR